MTDLAQVPVFAICGYSGAGKTTLILEVLARARRWGLSAVVLKHDAHGLHVDAPGKDTDRFFSAGVDVVARDDVQTFGRGHADAGAGRELEALLWRLQTRYDLILVEGFKREPLPRKIWLRRHARDRPPVEVGRCVLDLGRDTERGDITWAFIEKTLVDLHRALPTFAGVLVGGRSRRMGKSKHLLETGGRTWLARIVSAVQECVDGVLLLGAATVPRSCAHLQRLPDVSDQSGPMAGICAAMRWNPFARWIFLSCDTPWLERDAVAWLKGQAGPGIWAVQPRLAAREQPQPFAGWYDSRARLLLEGMRGPSGLAGHPHTVSPVVPPGLRRSWLGCNTKAELARASRR